MAENKTIKRTWCGLCGTYIYDGHTIPCATYPRPPRDDCPLLHNPPVEEVPVTSNLEAELKALLSQITTAAPGDVIPLPDGITPADVAAASPLDVQVSGSHYKTKPIQPVEYIHANKIGYFEGNVIKYVTRWKDKGGLADLEKARHYIDLLIELETNLEKALRPDAEEAA